MGVTMPSLSSIPDGTGGPTSDLPLSTVQESALIAPQNPAGTFSDVQKGEIVVYTVQPGDTLSSVAASFGISLNTLLWANNLRSSSRIKNGDELVILPVSGVQYKIKKGDTIDSIAKQFKGDSNEILSFNGVAVGESLDVGDTLIIPDGELAQAPVQNSTPTTKTYLVPSFKEAIGYYIRPVVGGRRSRGIHGYNGVDLANSCGLPVYASADGFVILARTSGWNGGYGKYIVLTHGNGTQTLYAHLLNLLVIPGQKVSQGTQIGVIGSTGNSTGCHVHFEIRGAKNPF